MEILASLSGEDEGNAAVGAAHAISGAIGVAEAGCGVLCDQTREAAQLVYEVCLIGGHDREPSRSLGVVGLGTLPGQTLEHACSGGALRDGLCLRCHTRTVGAGDGQELDG